MAQARTVYLPNRLADAVDSSSGESPQRLISKAGDLVVALRPRIQAFVNARVEKLAAYVQPIEGASIGGDDVKAYLRQRLANYKVPSHVKLVDTLPREDSGKIMKRKLREPYWAGVGRRI